MSQNFQQPEYKRFENLEFLARQIVEGFITGLHKSPFHGFSVEFAEHRIYNPGESTRNIDWKLFARTEKLFTKRYDEETNLRCQMVLDCSSSMYFPCFDEPEEKLSKIDFAAQASACIIHLLKKQRDAAGLTLFTDRTIVNTQARSNPAHTKVIFSHLENLVNRREFEFNKKSNPAAVLHHIADNIHKRSLIIIFSDMFDNCSRPDEIYGALQHLKHNKHEVVLFHVYDKLKEFNLDYPNRPYRFIDMETSKEIKIIPGQIRESYRKALEKFHSELKIKCMQYKIDFVAADINEGFENVLLTFFHKRSKLF